MVSCVMFNFEKGKLSVVTCPYYVEVRNKQFSPNSLGSEYYFRISYILRCCWDVNKSHCYYTILVDAEVWVKYHFTMMRWLYDGFHQVFQCRSSTMTSDEWFRRGICEDKHPTSRVPTCLWYLLTSMCPHHFQKHHSPDYFRGSPVAA